MCRAIARRQMCPATACRQMCISTARRQICAANRRRDVRLPAAPATGERGYSAWGSRGARRARGRSPPKLDLDGLAHQSRASGSRRPQSSGRGLSPGPAIAHPAAPTASERPWPSQNLPRCCSAIAPAFCGSDLLTVLLTNDVTVLFRTELMNTISGTH